MHQREFRAYTGRILVFAENIQDYGFLDFYEDLAYLAVARSVGTRSVARARRFHDVLKIHDSFYLFFLHSDFLTLLKNLHLGCGFRKISRTVHATCTCTCGNRTRTIMYAQSHT